MGKPGPCSSRVPSGLHLVDRAKREATATMSGPNMFQTFYERLKGIREYHNKFGKQVQSTSVGLSNGSLRGFLIIACSVFVLVRP